MALTRLLPMACCVGILLAAASAQPPGKGVITGTVTDGATGNPVHKAVVTLTLQTTPRQWAVTRTDGSGRFQFDGLPAGKYDLRANKGQEGTAIMGATDLRSIGDLISLGEDQILGGIKLRFLHSASISGHVYDSDGDPVAGVNITLLRRGRNLGTLVLQTYRGGGTDDRGEYHIQNVEPGQYYLRSMAAIAGRSGPRLGGQPLLVDQYYGGSVEEKDASLIHVRSGESLAGLDFRLNSEAAVQIRGHVSGIPAETEIAPILAPGPGAVTMPQSFSAKGLNRGQSVQVMIRPAETGAQRWSSSTPAQGPDYRFQMPDVAAGRYRIEATLRTRDKSYGASEVLDLRADSGEILLSLAPAKDIKGTLRVEGHASSTSRSAAAQTVQTQNGGGYNIQLGRPGGGGNISGRVGADGKFVLEQVPAGDWQLAVNLPGTGFIKSALLGDKDVRFSSFEAASDAALNIVISMNTAAVEGELETSSSESKRAGIVLAPVKGPYHDWARFYYGATSDDNGKFRLEGIAPGKYRIFAVDKMAPAGFRNPEAIDQIYELGQDIELSESQTLRVQPRVIPMDRVEKALQ